MKKTPYLRSKSDKLSKFLLICIVFLLIICLFGCAKKDPVESIVDTHSDHITDVLDYTYNKFEQTIEIKFLENELETCLVALNDVKETHISAMNTEKAKTDYWRLASLGLFILLCGSLLAIIRRWFK